MVPCSSAECPTSPLLRVNTETAAFSEQTPSAGHSLLSRLAYMMSRRRVERVFPITYQHTDIHSTRDTVVFQRMLKTNPDAVTLINPAFWWLSANRIVHRRWRNIPVISFAGVESALWFHKPRLLSAAASHAPYGLTGLPFPPMYCYNSKNGAASLFLIFFWKHWTDIFTTNNIQLYK